MAMLSNIEIALLNDLDRQADELEKCKKDEDVYQRISDVVAKTAKVVVAMAKTGGVTYNECKRAQSDILGAIDTAIKSKVDEINSKIGESDWKARAAVWVPLSGAFFGLGCQVLRSWK